MRFRVLDITSSRTPWRIESPLGAMDIVREGSDLTWTWFDEDVWRLNAPGMWGISALMRNDSVCAHARLRGGWRIVPSKMGSIDVLRSSCSLYRYHYTDQRGGCVALAIRSGRPIRWLPFLRHNDYLMISKPSLACYVLGALLCDEEQRGGTPSDP